MYRAVGGISAAHSAASLARHGGLRFADPLYALTAGGPGNAHANRREPSEEKAPGRRAGAVHGGEPAAHPEAEVCQIINRETLLMAMIETPEAVANADCIAAVDGIDTLHIGASDLSTEMGIPGQYTHDRMKAT